MINFNLQPYEWRKDMSILMQNVNLNKIEFNIDNSIIFKFIDSFKGEVCENVECTNVWKFSIENNFEKGNAYPIFVCEVKVYKLSGIEIQDAFEYLSYGFGDIPKSKEYNLVCLDSGEICIELICETIIVNKIDS